ncbi:MAG: hypothetical protein Q7S40_31565 [Opitutaceae bacterium]|nr:hypothetical protein [Opitutaceae bacterium]
MITLPESPTLAGAPATDHDVIVPRLTADLVAAFKRAAGDEKKLRDAIFLFARRAHAAGIAPGWIAEILGVSVAGAPFTSAESDAVYRLFPRCGEIAVAAEQRRRARPGWWKLRQLKVRLTHDVGQQCI